MGILAGSRCGISNGRSRRSRKSAKGLNSRMKSPTGSRLGCLRNLWEIPQHAVLGVRIRSTSSRTSSRGELARGRARAGRRPTAGAAGGSRRREFTRAWGAFPAGDAAVPPLDGSAPASLGSCSPRSGTPSGPRSARGWVASPARRALRPAR